jgi:hypothetical protein
VKTFCTPQTVLHGSFGHMKVDPSSKETVDRNQPYAAVLPTISSNWFQKCSPLFQIKVTSHSSLAKESSPPPKSNSTPRKPEFENQKASSPDTDSTSMFRKKVRLYLIFALTPSIIGTNIGTSLNNLIPEKGRFKCCQADFIKITFIFGMWQRIVSKMLISVLVKPLSFMFFVRYQISYSYKTLGRTICSYILIINV